MDRAREKVGGAGDGFRRKVFPHQEFGQIDPAFDIAALDGFFQERLHFTCRFPDAVARLDDTGETGERPWRRILAGDQPAQQVFIGGRIFR